MLRMVAIATYIQQQQNPHAITKERLTTMGPSSLFIRYYTV